MQANELRLQAICLVGIAPDNQMGTDREPPSYLVGNSPYMTIYGHGIPHWTGSTIYQAREYCVFILSKYLHYPDGPSVHQN